MSSFNTRPPDLLAFGKALRAARKLPPAALTLDQLAAATGISKPYLSNIETARAPGPPSEKKLRALARALHLDPAALLAAADWLRTPASVRHALLGAEAHTPRRPDGTIDLDRLMDNEKSPPKTSAADPATFSPPPAALPLKQIPLINRVAAGKAGEFGDLSYPAGIADAYISAPDLPDAPAGPLFALRVVGDSMLPEYREGDILIVGPGDPRDGDDCVIRTSDHENFATTFKRLFFLKDPAGDPSAPPISARLVPLNPAHPERVIPLEEITGIYPLVYRLIPTRTARGAPRKEPLKPSAKLKG